MKTLEQRIAEIGEYRKSFNDQIVRGDLVSCLGKLKDSLDLIQELQEENETLRKCSKVTDESWRELMEENAKLKQQNKESFKEKYLEAVSSLREILTVARKYRDKT